MKETDKPQVELQNAYAWHCPTCGSENFCRAEVMDIGPDEKRRVMAQAEGIEVEDIVLTDEELSEIVFNCSPANVTCDNCDEVFESAPFEEPPDIQ